MINLAIRGVEHYEVVERIDEVQTPVQCETLFVEDPIIEARYSNQDDTINKERVDQNIKSTPTERPSYSPRVTPHKRADYRSPLKRYSSRKKRANPDKWKRNVRQLQRVSGE